MRSLTLASLLALAPLLALMLGCGCGHMPQASRGPSLQATIAQWCPVQPGSVVSRCARPW
jgi:hypothetical protein